MGAALSLHVAAGALGLAAGYLALFAGKGARLHRRSGIVFVCAMSAMALTASALAVVHGLAVEMNMGLLTTYLVVTGWTTVRRPTVGAWWVDSCAMLLALAVGGALVVMGLAAVAGVRAHPDMPVPMYFVFGCVALGAGLSDLRPIRSGGVPAARRLARHLWRMCVALLIAAASFFFGQADTLPVALRHPALLAPPVLVAPLVMAYWLWRLRRGRAPCRGRTRAAILPPWSRPHPSR